MNKKIAVPMAVEEVVIHEAICRRMDELQDGAATRADPRPWIKDRPLISCLLAAGAGVALGILAGGRKPAVSGQTVTDGNPTQAYHNDHRTLGAVLAATLVSTIKPGIRDLVHTAMDGLTKGTDKAANVTA